MAIEKEEKIWIWVYNDKVEEENGKMGHVIS